MKLCGDRCDEFDNFFFLLSFGIKGQKKSGIIVNGDT